jgi:hypothetical protein
VRLGLFNKKNGPNPAMEGYVKGLGRQIEDAAKMLTVVESDGWPLVQQLWQDFEARSQTAFLAGEIPAEEHKAQLKAVRILVGGIEAIAANTKMDSDPKTRLRELEASKPSAFRRY